MLVIKTSFPLKRNGPNDLNKMISKAYGVKWVRESDKYSVKTESRRGCMQYSCAELSKVCVQNHQDNYFFFINIAYRSDAKPDKWTCVIIWKMKVQHLVSLFTLFRNNLVSAC